MIYVIGHKNPDTDSIVSAVVMADYFKRMGKQSKAARAGKINKEAGFVLNKAKIKPPSLLKSLAKKKVFLVDHNEIEQAGPDIAKAEIVGILDHHKLGGGMKTETPIYFRMEPLGSTATLVFKLFQEVSLQLTKKQSFLLLAGILSDTLKLTSPTTTKEDKKAAQILAKISKTDIGAFAQEIFRARSDISGIKLKDLISSDYKEYKEKGLVFGVGVHETLSPEILLKKEKEVFLALEELKKNKKLNLLFFALVDILKKEAYFFLSGEKEKEITVKAFKGSKIKENLFLLSGVVSRKKQIIPLILKNLRPLNNSA